MAIVTLGFKGAKACDFFLGAAYPDKVTASTGHSTVVFEDTGTPNGNWDFAMNRGYLAGGNDANLRVYWGSITATTGNARWRAEIERLAAGGNPITADNFGTAKEAHSAASGTLGALVYTDITLTNADMGAIAAGEFARLRLTRDTGDVNDTLVGNAYVLGWELTQDQP